MPTYIAALSLGVAPFLGTRGETSPLKIFDYLACARPVVASRIDAVEDIIASCEAVIAVPPEDAEALASAINQVLADPARAAKLGARGRTFIVEHHSWRQMAEETAEALEAVRRR